MTQREIFITQFDRDRLEELIQTARTFGVPGGPDWARLEELQRELEKARIVASTEVPPDVVTMNSRLLLRDLDGEEDLTVTLVFPKDADLTTGAMSILAPIGTAILGYREGDEVEWPVPSGTRRIRIARILYQPEQAGDYHL